MRAYRMQVIDGQQHLSLQDAPRPEPGPGQLLLRVRAAGLNRGEFIRGHSPQQTAPEKPIGIEAAGEVVALGPDTAPWALGDRVMGRSAGAFAEYALVDLREALAVPPTLDWRQAAAVPLTFMVVYDMLAAQGRLQAGETLLIAGVSSGVGVAALQAAKAIGAKVVGTSGSAAKLARLKDHGLDLGLHTRAADFSGAVREMTGGRGADLAIDTVGGTVFAECVRSLGYEGRLAMVGYVDGVLKAELDLEALHSNRLHLFGVSNRFRTPAQRTEAVAGFRRDWLPLFVSGAIQPLVDRVLPFEQLAEAKRSMEAGEHVGKIVLAGSEDAR